MAELNYELKKKMQESILKHGAFLLAPPRKVYHYTTMSGLYGILTHRELWATHAGFLNDTQEIQYTLAKILGELKKGLSSDIEESKKSYLEHLHRYYAANQFPDVFLISFSEKEDDLNQWRAYSDNAQGICLEFDTTEQAQMIDYHNALYVKVIYDASLQDAMIEEYINECYSRFVLKAISLTGAAEMCIQLLNTFIPIFKHPTFAAEMEVRFVLPNYHIGNFQSPDAEFREKNSLLIPYIKVPFGPEAKVFSAITKVILGPALNAEQAQKSVRLFLNSRKYGDILTTSKIPYRGT